MGLFGSVFGDQHDSLEKSDTPDAEKRVERFSHYCLSQRRKWEIGREGGREREIREVRAKSRDSFYDRLITFFPLI